MSASSKDAKTALQEWLQGRRTAACAGTGTPLTVYIIGTASSLYDAVVTQGKALYTESSRTILLSGGNSWFKTTSAPATGETFLVSSAGEVPSWGGTC